MKTGMGIPVGVQTAASARAVVSFRCVHCGYNGRAEVVGMGEGAQSYLNAPGTAEARAREDAQKDIARTIARARCPSCARRDPRGVLRFFGTYAALALVFMVAGVAAGFAPTWFDINMSDGDKAICRWVVPLIFAVSLALILPFTVLIKWSTTDARVRWLDR